MTTSDRIVPIDKGTDLPSFTVLADGKKVNEEYPVISVVVTRAVNKISTAKLMLLDGEVATQDFEISNKSEFEPGKEIEIKAGYHQDEETIFKGTIIKHGVKARQGKPSMLCLELKDNAVKMTVGRESAYFIDSKDSEIIEEIIGNYSLKKDVDATSLKHKEMVQFRACDWDFVIARAEANGLLVYTTDGKVEVKKPDFGSKPVIKLIYGASLFEFEGEIDSRDQFKKVTASSWDYADQKVIEEAAAEPSIKEHGKLKASDLNKVIGVSDYRIEHSGQVIDTELKAWANGLLLKQRMAKVRGRARCQGFNKLFPGKLVEFEGVGEKFTGNAFISGIRHQIDENNWISDIEFGLSPDWLNKEDDYSDLGATGLLPAANGLQIGVVSQLESDPDGEDRILVKAPIIDSSKDGIWCRIATLDAGKERGSFFRPEIGDEVVMGFLNDDPRDPVILGMLNSSAKPAPLTAKDDNPEKGFVTREKLKLLFNDEKKIITIETPNGNKITLSDDEGMIEITDENKNVVTLDSAGVTVDSPADITLTAKGDVSIEGTNVNLKAKAQFKAEGSAGAEMSTGAMAVVKGSIVQIN
jgi:Rhs element Vgr protein